MKVAVTGKGGTGKTTVCATLAKAQAETKPEDQEKTRKLVKRIKEKCHKNRLA